MSDLISVIETAYRADLSQRRWLSELTRVARPLLDDGLGVWTTLYDASDPQRFRLISPIGSGIVAKGLSEVLSLCARLGPVEHIQKTFGSATCGTISELLGPAFVRDSNVARYARLLGIEDSLGINCTDTSGRGLVISVPQRQVRRTPTAVVETWSRVAAHVAAGLRLRRRIERRARGGDPLDHADAILDPDGRVEHAVGDARSEEARAALRGAAVALDRIRARTRREQPDHALASWNVLVDAQWSIIDHFDRDGRRYVIAMRNDADVPRRDGWEQLTPREQQIAAYVALGHANKLIAYELGIAESTVATHLARAAMKLDIRSRVEWVKRFSLRARR